MGLFCSYITDACVRRISESKGCCNTVIGDTAEGDYVNTVALRWLAGFRRRRIRFVAKRTD